MANLYQKLGYEEEESTIGSFSSLEQKLTDKKDVSVLGDMMEQFGAGIQDAGVEIAQTALSLTSFITDPVAQELQEMGYVGEFKITKDGWETTSNFSDSTIQALEEYQDSLPEAQTTAGKLTHAVAQVAIPLGLYAKGLSALGIGSKLVQAYGAGVLTDFSVFDPHEERLSNLVQEFEGLRNPITEYLAADPNDTEAEGRMKSVLEGLALGGIVDTAMSASRILKGKDIAKEVISEKESVKAITKGPSIRYKIQEQKKANLPMYQQMQKESKYSIMQKGLSEKALVKVTNSVTDATLGKMDSSQKIMNEVADLLIEGEIDVTSLPNILAKNNMKPEEFAEQLVESASHAGKYLSHLSHLKRRMNTLIETNPEYRHLQEMLDKTHNTNYALDRILDTWGSIENTRRAFLVTQLGTAVRNMTGAVMATSTHAVDSALQSVFEKPFRAIGAKKAAKVLATETSPALRKEARKVIAQHQTRDVVTDIKAEFNALGTFTSRMSKEGQKRFWEVLDTQHGELAKSRLLYTPVQEVTMGKLAHTLNIFNRFQEVMFRKMAFEGKMRQLLKQSGKDWATIDPKAIPKDMYDEAVQHALYVTFAQAPKSRAGKQLLHAWQKFGGTLINPFPRFNFANAIPFAFNHSPLGFLRVMDSKLYNKFMTTGSGSKEYAEILSQATVGTGLMAAAYHWVNSDYAGEKWYEFKNPTNAEEVIDVRAYAPFSAYFLIAKAAKDKVDLWQGKSTIEYIKPDEIVQLLTGMNRVQGTGLALVDTLRAKDPAQVERIIDNIAGQYFGSFSVPLRQVKDVISPFADEETIIRDVKQNPIIAPFVANIPFLSRALPEARTPYKDGKAHYEHQVAKQLLGLNIRTKNIIEREIDRLDISKRAIYAGTGIAKANTTINGIMGSLNEEILMPVLESSQYQQMAFHEQRLLVREILKHTKGGAMGMYALEDWETFMELKEKRMDPDTKMILELSGWSGLQ